MLQMPYDRKLGSTDPHPDTPSDGAAVADTHGDATAAQPDSVADTVTDRDTTAPVAHTVADRDVAVADTD